MFDERVEDWHIDRTHHFPLYCAAFWLSSDDWQSVSRQWQYSVSAELAGSRCSSPLVIVVVSRLYIFAQSNVGGDGWMKLESKGGDEKVGAQKGDQKHTQRER